jgi:plastocyanin
MRMFTDRPQARFTGASLLALLTSALTVGACASPAPPSQSTTAAPSSASPHVAAGATPSAAASPSPSPTVAIVKVTPIPGAPDSKIVVQLVAAHAKWDLSTLTAPAGKTWHVKIDNQETFLKHNFTVASGKTVAERIFQSPNFGFGTSAFDVPALPAGTYLFVCTIHPETMTGTLTIR